MSPDFLASDFIQNNELPPLLNAAKDDKAMILWMAVRPSMHEGTVIDKYQALNDPSKPLSTLTRPEQEKELKRIFQKLKEAIQSTSAAPVGIHDDAREDFPMSAPQQMPTHEQVQPPSEAASIGHGDEFRTKNQSPTKPRKISQRDRLPRSSHPALAESKLQTELPIETRSSQLDGTLPLPIASTIGRTDNEGAKSFDIEVRGYELVASFENSVLNVPLTVDRLTMDLLDLFEDWLQEGRVTRQLEIEIYGTLLYRTLFSTSVEQAFDKALYWAHGAPGRLLNLRLSFTEESNLAELPWEYLYHPATVNPGFFLATSSLISLSLVRHSLLVVPRIPAGQLRVLLVVSAPQGLVELPAEPLVDAIRSTARDCGIQLVVQTGVTVERLRGTLDEYCPEMVHLIAHSRLEETGATAVAFNSDGGLMWVGERELTHFLSGARPRLVVLDLPDRSNLAARMINAGIENVIEQRKGMPLDVAVVFHRALYRAIAAGKDLATAVQHARIAAAAEASVRPDAATVAAAFYTSSRESSPLVTGSSPQAPGNAKNRSHSEALLVDIRPLVGPRGSTVKVDYPVSGEISDFLDELYRSVALIDPKFPMNTYGRLWALRRPDTGKIFKDMGRTWAKDVLNAKSDNRRLDEVGITPGMILEAIRIREGKLRL